MHPFPSPTVSFSKLAWSGCLFAIGFFASQGSSVGQPPSTVQAIGGHWFVQKREGENANAVYLFKDGDRFVDLFSYHQKDSNKDGIENLELSHDDEFLIIQSQGYPNHPTAIFPNSSNPNSIRIQRFVFRFPLRPKLADEITRLPMGPVGMALNGVVFFNPYEQEGMNAVEGYTEVWLDSCCGHPQQTGVYHYHKYPSCVKSPFADDGKQHSPVIGFAFDGFPVYGPYESDGLMAKDIDGSEDLQTLDVCNGHSDATRGYHYHVTPGRFPYITGGYAGVVESSNNRGLHRAGKGALVDNTQAGSREGNVIISVRPGIGAVDSSQRITFELKPDASQRSLPTEAPDWIQVGPYQAADIVRDGNFVKANLRIPEDATVGVFFDCHLEFGKGAYPMVIKKNDVFRLAD